MRKPESDNEFVGCRVSLIKWVATYMQQIKKNSDGGPSSIVSTHSAPPSHPSSAHEEESQSESAHPSLECCMYFGSFDNDINFLKLL